MTRYAVVTTFQNPRTREVPEVPTDFRAFDDPDEAAAYADTLHGPEGITVYVTQILFGQGE